MKLIKKLTPEQAAELPVHRETWRGIGLSTQPADFERAKKAIGWIYTERLKKPVPMFLCFSSGTLRIVRPNGETVTSFEPGDAVMRRVGKKAAGALLDGQEHREMPT